MIKFILKTIFVLLVLLIVALVGVYYYAGDIIKKAVETYVPDITKTTAKLENVDISLLKGEVSLSGLEIGNPKGFKSPDIFSVKKIAVSFDPKSVLTDKIVINRILVDGTHVSAEATYKNGNISSNISTLKNNVDAFMKKSSSPKSEPKAETKKETPAQSASNKAVVIKDLQINNSALTLGFLNQTVNIPLPDIRQQNIGQKDKKTTIKDVAVMIFDMISIESMKATAKGVQDVLKQSTQAVIDNAKGLVDSAKEDSKNLMNAVKNIF